MNDDAEKIELCDADFQAAKLALERNRPDLKANNAEYRRMRDALAELHHRFGKDNFELRYRLRPPKNRFEELTRPYMHGEISEAEYGSRLKADAERPIDLEMLTDFHGAYASKLEVYSKILQSFAVDGRAPLDSAQKDREIDDLIQELDGQIPIWIENLETTFDFLGEVRARARLGLVTVGEFEGNTAHWLAHLVFKRTIDGWKSCQAVSHRSRSDGRYLYSSWASDLFRKTHVKLLPRPQSLLERMMIDYNLGRSALKQGCGSSAEVVESGSTLELVIDNESKAATLAGEMQTIVAKAGQIFRLVPPPDWGIDAEIEFKDSNGHATGERLYLQLKSGDSYLTKCKGDNKEIFRIQKKRHADYWRQQQYPVMLVIRGSDGRIRWMCVSEYLKREKERSGVAPQRIVFDGEDVTVQSILKKRVEQLGEPRR